MTQDLKIKIFTRSFDLRLYRLSKGLYEDLGWPVVRLTDKSADGYFYSILKDSECDIAVNIDEDAFLTDPQALKELLQRVLEGGYANAGCPDGGSEALPRCGDPHVTNPFFNILDLRQIRPAFDRSLLHRKSGDLEPYYPFFRWMADNFKTLYLPAAKHPDGISTILQDCEGHSLLLHSWFARFYSMPGWMVQRVQNGLPDQRARIDALIDEAYAIRGLARPVFRQRDRALFVLNDILRWTIKIPQRISRWPGKLRRRLSDGIG